MIDRATAARFGITPATVDNALYDLFGQRIISTIYTQSNQYRVIMEADPSLQNLARCAVRDLPAVSRLRHRPGAAQRHRRGRAEARAVADQPSGAVPGDDDFVRYRAGIVAGRRGTAIRQAETDIGLPDSFVTAFQGAASALEASLSNELLLVLAAIVTVYIVLGVLYESFIHPITIISTLPSAGAGALVALWIAGDDIDVIAIIGIILLIGIVKKNAIMMIDFALVAEREEGKSPREAIHQACLLRFRPIMMTTMAALLGALPLMLGNGTGSELRRPLGVAIVGGLLVSQVLTLFTTPVIYLMFDRLAWRVARQQAGRRARRNEHFRALHRASRRDHPADHRHRAGRHLRVLQAAGLAAAAGGFPHHLGAGAVAGRQPGHGGDQRRRTAGAPSRADRRRHRDDLHQRRRARPGSSCSSA